MRAVVLGCALVLGGLPGLFVPCALAHSGHGDEFVQNGSVDQVGADLDQDQLLGIITNKPKLTAEGQLTVPNASIVDVDGQPLVFVYSGTTYDPVFIRTGTVLADQTVVLEGVTANEDVVVSGALSLFAESQKKDRSLHNQQTTSTETHKHADSDQATATSPQWLLLGRVGVAVVVVIAAIVGFRSLRDAPDDR